MEDGRDKKQCLSNIINKVLNPTVKERQRPRNNIIPWLSLMNQSEGENCSTIHSCIGNKWSLTEKEKHEWKFYSNKISKLLKPNMV